MHVLSDAPDPRGSSFSIPENRLPPDFVVRDAHVMTVQPGAVRGDHFHCAKREVFLVTYLDSWSLHWDGGRGTSTARAAPRSSYRRCCHTRSATADGRRCMS